MMDTVLLIEDSNDDVFFFKRAFTRAGIKNPLQVLADGRQAIEYLKGVSPYEDRLKYPLPRLVLLDLKLPYVLGLDVLEWIRSQEEFRTLPVIVFTSSSERADLDRAYRLGANSYVVKPSGSEHLLSLTKCLAEYWLSHNLQPAVSPG